MKKCVLIVMAIALAATSVCVAAGCDKGDGEALARYKPIEKDTYKVGDKYKSEDAEIVAVLKDGTERKVTKNLIFDDFKNVLKLDKDDKFTERGEYEVTVYVIEKREDFKVGVWKIVVA